jgi:magnesium chelatase subunit D
VGGVTDDPASPESGAVAYSPWELAMIVAAVFAVDPAGLGGVSIKARAGPVRDQWMARLRDLLPEGAPMRRVPVGIPDSRLLGGLDLAATLRAGRPMAERGILAEADGGVVILPMAERLEPGIVARLGASLDSGEILVERDGMGLRAPSRFGVVAFDESIGEDERPHPALLDRLAFLVDLDPIGPRDMDDIADDATTRDAIDAARARLGRITIGEPVLKALCGTAVVLGISSLRASVLALRAARVIAALNEHDEILAEDATLAARLVLSPRATTIPIAESPDQGEPEPEPEQAEAEPETPDSEPPSDPGDGQDNSDPEDGDSEKPLDDLVLAAAAASIPADLLARLRIGEADRMRSSAPGKAGIQRASAKRGRPIGVRAGEPKDGARLNLIETLRAAAPWQRIRRAAGDTGRVIIRRDDFRLPRLRQRSETTTIFAVDASGSSALNRLAEAKGAVELLLAECYIRRDKVALIAFRGRGAELLLPPTRSLVRAKRCLANLPGGGGTPLADGIDAAAALADGLRRQGSTPVVVLMTDGRANVARGGAAGRVQAEADARAAARKVRAAGLAALLVDTSPRAQSPRSQSARAQPLAARLAADMGATYLPLPSADAAALSRGVRAATGGSGGK